MKKMLKEFGDFINRGNVIGMATGIIIGAAFTTIVNSLVNDLISPLIGLFTGGIDFSNLVLVLRPATENTAALTLKFGSFINAVINFLIIAFVVFNIVKLTTKAKQKLENLEKSIIPSKKEECEKKEQPAPVQSEEVAILKEIRDLLKK